MTRLSVVSNFRSLSAAGVFYSVFFPLTRSRCNSVSNRIIQPAYDFTSVDRPAINGSLLLSFHFDHSGPSDYLLCEIWDSNECRDWLALEA